MAHGDCTGHALGYIRTSSAANVGGHSEPRQRTAIVSYAEAQNIEVVGWFSDMAVSGADPVETRRGFAAMLDRIETNGVRLVIVEDASRFARDLVAQELGILLMQQRGVRVVAANGDDLTNNSDPARVVMRQVAGAFVQYEKARLNGKLKSSRDRKSETAGKRIEGRKGYVGHQPGVIVALADMQRETPSITLQALADGLADRGYLTVTGKTMAPNQVRRLLTRTS
jgi:DNA invertase Pin-like site-specific DNA recombinase